MKKQITLKITYSAVCLALCMLLPLLTGQIPQFGTALSPMHIPALLCGLLCGWQYGLVVGAIAPILRSLVFTMPPMYPTAIAMSFELATYGAISGLLYALLPKKNGYLYVSLVVAMLVGRMVWGVAQYTLLALNNTQFTLEMFVTAAFVKTFIGIVCHIALIPPIVMALKKASLVPNAVTTDKTQAKTAKEPETV